MTVPAFHSDAGQRGDGSCHAALGQLGMLMRRNFAKALTSLHAIRCLIPATRSTFTTPSGQALRMLLLD